ncbi:MAG TPA: hypothetical protein VFT26_00180, partial [Pyrinomonadaceae bacterium]|nr:hypothetical protein [Pyrinomonadaceae bacterium]
RWRLKFRGYQRDEILTQTLKTDSEGAAQLNFTPDREGYYRVAWQSNQGVDAKRDRFLPPVKAETYVFVASNTTTDIGYRQEGLEIIADKDTFRAGQTAPVMISVPVPDRYVLFSVEGEDLFSYQVVHVSGNTKLIEVPIEEKHVPNIYLSAFMISNANAYSDMQQVVVPPIERFLQVAVKADREQYQPREEGTLAISAKDAHGRPVAAEIALGLVDESVKYIQQDYAGDPRQFYYGSKRPHTVQTQSTLDQKSYARFEEVAPGELRDRKDGVNEEDEVAAPVTKDQMGYGVGTAAGVGGGVRRSAESNMALDGLASSKQITNLPIQGRQKGDFAALARPAKPGSANVDAQEPTVQVRSDFRSTILWLPDVKTDADGTA